MCAVVCCDVWVVRSGVLWSLGDVVLCLGSVVCCGVCVVWHGVVRCLWKVLVVWCDVWVVCCGVWVVQSGALWCGVVDALEERLHYQEFGQNFGSDMSMTSVIIRYSSIKESKYSTASSKKSSSLSIIERKETSIAQRVGKRNDNDTLKTTVCCKPTHTD